jgi:hypothetical protein
MLLKTAVRLQVKAMGVPLKTESTLNNRTAVAKPVNEKTVCQRD